MKIIITEQQSNFLLHDLLDELFEGYREEYVATGEKLIYVGDKLMMVWQPTKAILSKDIMEKVQGELFYDSMKEFKSAIKSWLLKHFPVKQGVEMMYGVSFKNFEDDVKIIKRRKNKDGGKFKEKG